MSDSEQERKRTAELCRRFRLDPAAAGLTPADVMAMAMTEMAGPAAPGVQRERADMPPMATDEEEIIRRFGLKAPEAKGGEHGNK
jgi:hypothetical protein